MTKTIKVTKKDRYADLVKLIDAAEVISVGADGEYDFDALRDFCANEIMLLDKKAAKAKETAKAKKSADPLLEAIQQLLTDEYQTISDIAKALDDESITPAKISYRLSSLVKEEIAESTDVTVSGGEGQKSRKVKGYKLAS